MPDMQLIHYLRKGKTPETIGVPIGLLLGSKLHDGTVKVSWSFCHRNDCFTKKEARMFASYRMGAPDAMLMQHTPKAVLAALPAFVTRCSKYFRVLEEDIEVVDYLSKEVST